MDFSKDREECRVTTCYEVWRYSGYNRKTDIYDSQELIGCDDNIGSAMFLLGRLSGLQQLSPCGPADFNAGHAKWGVEFLDRWGNMEYWCVIAK